MSRRLCCVFQPFDKGGDFDKRYDEILAPAIGLAGLESYRVDRDDGALVPIDTLHSQICSAAACVADITTDNPNVMYEIGYAFGKGIDVVLICGPREQGRRFPFDIQHRGVIEYATGAMSDFKSLGERISARLTKVLDKQSSVEAIVDSTANPSDGLRPHEVATLALVMANRQAPEDGVVHYRLREDMEKTGYNALATSLGLTGLMRKKLLTVTEQHEFNGDTYLCYLLTAEGENWLLSHAAELGLEVPQARLSNSGDRLSDPDIPF